MSATFTSSETTNAQGSQGMQNTVSGRIFFLDIASGRVLSANPDGSGLKTIVREAGGRLYAAKDGRIPKEMWAAGYPALRPSSIRLVFAPPATMIFER